MSTVVLERTTPELEALKERRARAGLDRLDEVWEGVLHMVPAPSHEHGRIAVQLVRLIGPAADAAGLEMTDACNIGRSEEDFRVPDLALHRPGATGVWHPTAALVVEIVSPDDETWQKLPFYAAHGVDEVLIADPQERSVQWLTLSGGEYREVERSDLIELGPAELSAPIEWP
jgi:Uma2 family endonuclease